MIARMDERERGIRRDETIGFDRTKQRRGMKERKARGLGRLFASF